MDCAEPGGGGGQRDERLASGKQPCFLERCIYFLSKFVLPASLELDRDEQLQEQKGLWE